MRVLREGDEPVASLALVPMGQWFGGRSVPMTGISSVAVRPDRWRTGCATRLMRATLEEKTSRVVEVIISSMKPWHLMLGKILGVGAVSLTQMAIWLLAGGLLFVSGLPMLIAARPELARRRGTELSECRAVVIRFVDIIQSRKNGEPVENAFDEPKPRTIGKWS